MPSLTSPLQGGSLQESRENRREAVLSDPDTFIRRKLFGNDQMDTGAQDKEQVGSKHRLPNMERFIPSTSERVVGGVDGCQKLQEVLP
jgi:hypothetical protein